MDLTLCIIVMITSFYPINSMIILHQINYIMYLKIVCQFCAEYKRIEFFTELNTTSPHIRCDIKLASNFPRSINLASHKFSLLAARSLHHAAAQQIFQHSLFRCQFRSYHLQQINIINDTANFYSLPPPPKRIFRSSPPPPHITIPSWCVGVVQNLPRLEAL